MDILNRRRRSLGEELSRHRARAARLAEQGAVLRASLDQAELRMLIAETPLADRDRRLAVTRLRTAERHLAEVERRLRDLEREWARLGQGPETVADPRP